MDSYEERVRAFEAEGVPLREAEAAAKAITDAENRMASMTAWDSLPSPKLKTEPIRIIITVIGGIAVSAATNIKGLQVVVHDLDAEQAGEYPWSAYEAEHNPDEVAKVFGEHWGGDNA